TQYPFPNRLRPPIFSRVQHAWVRIASSVRASAVYRLVTKSPIAMPARCHACMLQAMRTQAFSKEKLMSNNENDRKLISFAGRQGVRFVALITILLTSSLFLLAQADKPASYPSVPYPVGYRDWTHVKSNLIGPESPMYKQIGGYQHVYANKKGMEGYRA